MSTEKLDLGEFQYSHRAEWFWQRIGWTIWLIVIVAGLLGFLGPGLLTRATVRASDDSMIVEFDEYVHQSNETDIAIELHPSPGSGDVHLHVNQAFVDRAVVRRIQPEPIAARSGADGLTWTFARADNVDRLQVVVYFEYRTFGRSSVTLRMDDRAALTFSQVIYP